MTIHIRYSVDLRQASPVVVLERNRRCTDRVILRIDEYGDVWCGIRSYYGGDGQLIEEYHGRTLVYEIETSDTFVFDDLQALLNRECVQNWLGAIVSSHSVVWDGRNHVGRWQNPAGAEASQELGDYLARDHGLTSCYVVCSCDDWLWDWARHIRPDMTDQELDDFAATTADQALNEYVILTDDVLEWARETRAIVRLSLQSA